MTVWLLQDYDEVLGVYSTQERANIAQERYRSPFCPQEFELDEMPPPLSPLELLKPTEIY